MNEHISQPLAKFLKDNGFKKESLYCYDVDELKEINCFAFPPSGKEIIFKDGTWTNSFIRVYPAYSWDSILEEYSIELFGDKFEGRFKILSLLQQGKVAEAENIVREQFINKK